jgi:hypothetical protein
MQPFEIVNFRHNQRKHKSNGGKVAMRRLLLLVLMFVFCSAELKYLGFLNVVAAHPGGTESNNVVQLNGLKLHVIQLFSVDLDGTSPIARLNSLAEYGCTIETLDKKYFVGQKIIENRMYKLYVSNGTRISTFSDAPFQDHRELILSRTETRQSLERTIPNINKQSNEIKYIIDLFGSSELNNNTLFYSPPALESVEIEFHFSQAKLTTIIWSCGG